MILRTTGTVAFQTVVMDRLIELGYKDIPCKVSHLRIDCSVVTVAPAVVAAGATVEPFVDLNAFFYTDKYRCPDTVILQGHSFDRKQIEDVLLNRQGMKLETLKHCSLHTYHYMRITVVY